jgi:hypothetical protein
MNIFEYLEEEGSILDKKLKEILVSLKESTREEIFDEIKLSCDNITGYLSKQQKLLLDTLADFRTSLKTHFDAHKKKMDALQNELETLTMVHVDEPGYDKYIHSLLLRLRECNTSLKELSVHLVQTIPEARLNNLNEQLEQISHGSVQFNSLPVEKEMEEKAGVKQTR